MSTHNSWPKQWFDLPIAVFDLETTGLDPKSSEIIEIGIVQFYRGEVVKQFNWLIDPETVIPDVIVKITGITQADVEGQPKFRDIAKDVLACLEGHALVAYNASFDCGFLNLKFNALGLKFPVGNPLIDPLIFARHFYPDQDNKLVTVAKRLEINLVDAHRASNDAEATGKVLFALRNRLPPDLEGLLMLQSKWELEYIEHAKRRRYGRTNDSNFGSIMSAGPVSKELDTAFVYGNESDPLRALYNAVPNAK